MRIALIAALSRNGVIGRDGDLPWRLPDDQAHFKRTTRGHPVLMGRKTWESLGGPLPGRRNLVLSRDPDFAPAGATVVRSLEEGVAAAGAADTLFVIGGAALYAAFLPRADELHLTHVDAEVEGDVCFPEVDLSRFREVERVHHPADARHAHAFDIVRYQRQRS